MAGALVAVLGCRDGASQADAGGSRRILAQADAAAEIEADAAPDVEVRDAEPDADLRTLIDHALTLLEDVGTIVQANMKDCDAMAAGVERYRQAHLAEIDRTDLIYDSRNEAELRRLQPFFHARYRAAWGRISPGIKKCDRNTNMRRVIGEVWGNNEVDGGE